MAALNGYADETNIVLSKCMSGFYGYTPVSCPWDTKTFRLSSTVCNTTGNGFLELIDATSPGYAFVEFTLGGDQGPFSAAAEGASNYNPYMYNKSDVVFPQATLTWQGIRQLGVFGTDVLALDDPFLTPELLVLGFELDDGASGPLIILANQQLAFLVGNIKILIQTPYYVAP